MCALCHKGSFEPLSRVIFDVLDTFLLKVTFGHYLGLIRPLKRDQQRILRIIKGKASAGRESESAVGCSCYGTPT